MKSLPSFYNKTRPPAVALWESLPEGIDIKGWWRRMLSDVNELAVDKVLEELKKRDRWLACECKAGAAVLPLLAICENPSGTGLHLRRLTGRDTHDQHCAFIFERLKRMVQLGGTDTALPIVPPPFLEPDPPIGGPCGPAGGVVDGIEEYQRHSSLARQLSWILHHAGTQHWHSDMKNPIRAILDYAQNCLPERGVSLSDLIFCKPAALVEGWIERAFKRCVDQGLQAQAILVCPVYDLDPAQGRVNLSNNPDQEDWHKVSTHPTVYGDRHADVRFPMLMYAKVMPGQKGPVLRKAYLHPVYSERMWMLVDSQLERDAMTQLMKSAKALTRSMIDVEIFKPVFDWMQTGARPDFVVLAKRAGVEYSFMVETMGSNDPEYLERKVRTIEKLVPSVVFKDDRTQKKEVADARLSRYILGHIRGNL